MLTRSINTQLLR